MTLTDRNLEVLRLKKLIIDGLVQGDERDAIEQEIYRIMRMKTNG